MKALLLAFSFLLLFSIVIFSSRKACTEFMYDSFLYLKKEQLYTQFYCKAQKNLFRNAHSKKPAAKSEEFPAMSFGENEKAAPRVRAKWSRDYEMSKINLAFLADPQLYPETRERVATMLLEIYGESPHRPALIQSQEEALALLDALGEAMKKAESNDRFRDFKLSHHQSLFYHLLQGTQKFDLQTRLGVIPFEDLFICHTASSKTVLFCQGSSLTSIELIFSKEFAQKVAQEEKKLHQVNRSRLSVGEWTSLIQSDIDSDYAEEALQWINGTSKGPPRIKTVYCDQDTGLKMEGPPTGKQEEEQE